MGRISRCVTLPGVLTLQAWFTFLLTFSVSVSSFLVKKKVLFCDLLSSALPRSVSPRGNGVGL